jgi:hypothetical protein
MLAGRSFSQRNQYPCWIMSVAKDMRIGKSVRAIFFLCTSSLDLRTLYPSSPDPGDQVEI